DRVRRHRRRHRLRLLHPLGPEPDRLGALLLRPAHAPARRTDHKARGETRMRSIPAALAFAGAVALASPAQAFCGFFVGKADGKLFNQSSQVAIVRDGDRTVITMGNDFKGDMNEFALVVPVPSVLTRDQIHVGERKLLERLDAYSAPRLVEYTDEDPVSPRHLYPMAARSNPLARPGET